MYQNLKSPSSIYSFVLLEQEVKLKMKKTIRDTYLLIFNNLNGETEVKYSFFLVNSFYPRS